MISSKSRPVRRVVRHQTSQPAQHHRHVRAEDASTDVRLVHHDQRQPEEEVRPSRVVGQQGEVEHVRVRHHEVGVLADQGSLGLRRVAVVDGCLQLGDLQRAHRTELIARECLCRIEVERRRLGDRERRFRERGVVDEGLPAGRPGRHDQVLVAAQRLQAADLVSVEAGDAQELSPLDEQIREVGRERVGLGDAGRELPDADERRRHLRIGGEGGEEGVRVHVAQASGVGSSR